ncbi:hypothetical protein D3C83_46720 [compost metagenome]
MTSFVGNKLGADLPTQLQALADRIGENRVVAGVHYVQDITDGKALGQALARYFIAQAQLANNPALQWLWGKAAAEWQYP